MSFVALYPVVSDEDELCCCVCNNAVGDAHQCTTCKKYVHVICGEPADEEEGYGQKINCSNCLNEHNNHKAKGMEILN